MNLLMISGDRSLAEGKHAAFYNTLEEFHKHWDRIDVICPKASRGSTSSEFEVEPLFGNVFIHPSPWPLLFQVKFIFRKGREIFKHHKFDLITVHEYAPFYNGLGAYLLSLTTHIPYVLEIMHIPGLPRGASLKEFVYKYFTEFFIRFDARCAQSVRVINQKQTKDFLIQAGVPASKIKYIPAFYINLDIFKHESVDKKYDIIYVARLEANKGIFNLIKAVKILRETRSDLKVCVIGDGPLWKNIQRYIRDNRLESVVEMAGWLKEPEDVAGLLNQSRVFVNPSFNEGGPRVALEAMACGVPIITTPVGLMIDIIKDRENGLFTDWNHRKMASDIENLLIDKERQNRFREAGLELVKQFERKAAIKNYSDSLHALTYMRNLLIITQKVDEQDDLLGFFVDWLREFSKKFDKIFVITLAKGHYDLPSNIHVYSLGKERGNSKIARAFNFCIYLFKLVPQSSGIFAHMSPIFVMASWPVAFIYQKKIILWYLHRSVTFRLKVAEKLCYKIVTAAKESLKLKSSKIIETGHGINIEKFRTDRDWNKNGQLKILSVGRISKIKNYETLLEAARTLKDKGINFDLKIIGQPVMAPDFQYFESLKSLKEKLNLGEAVQFVGFVPHDKIVDYYKQTDIVVGLTPDGGIDKTMLEGMASGCMVLTSNSANRKYFGLYGNELVFDYGNSNDLANKVIALSQLSSENKNGISRFLIESVSKHHRLENLINQISLLI